MSKVIRLLKKYYGLIAVALLVLCFMGKLDGVRAKLGFISLGDSQNV